MYRNEMNDLEYEFNWWFIHSLISMVNYYTAGKELWSVADTAFGKAVGFLRAAECVHLINSNDFDNCFNTIVDCRYRVRCEVRKEVKNEYL